MTSGCHNVQNQQEFVPESVTKQLLSRECKTIFSNVLALGVWLFLEVPSNFTAPHSLVPWPSRHVGCCSSQGKCPAPPKCRHTRIKRDPTPASSSSDFSFGEDVRVSTMRWSWRRVVSVTVLLFFKNGSGSDFGGGYCYRGAVEGK